MPLMSPHNVSDIRERRRSVRDVKIFIAEETICDMLNHAEKGALNDSEVTGLLAGEVYRDDDGIYAVVSRTVDSGLLSDGAAGFSLSDTGIPFDELDRQDFNHIIVGWYRSHLGTGCLMSDTDVNTHSSVFGSETGFAVVIDPVKEELRVFESSQDGPRETSMIIIEDYTHMA